MKQDKHEEELKQEEPKQNEHDEELIMKFLHEEKMGMALSSVFKDLEYKSKEISLEECIYLKLKEKVMRDSIRAYYIIVIILLSNVLHTK